MKIVVLGAGTALIEVMGIVLALNDRGHKINVICALDDNSKLWGLTPTGVPVKGPLSTWNEFDEDVNFVFAIGSFNTRGIRESIIQRLGIPESRFVSLVHPEAWLDPSCQVGAGVIIHRGVSVCGGAKIESFSIITFDCTIAANVVIKRGSMLASKSMLLTNSNVGPCAFVGAGSIIAENVVLGECSASLLGSVVLSSVPAGRSVSGNPARLAPIAPVVLKV